MNNILRDQIAKVVEEQFNDTASIILTRPDEMFGDYSTNVAMQLAGKMQQNPRDIAAQIAHSLSEVSEIADVSVAGPGFINITLTDSAIFTASNQTVPNQGGTLLLEYSCPNPFKELHVGHLYQTILGDALGRVYSRLGKKVYRVNFGGDVGLHVAKSIWAMIDMFEGEHPLKLTDVPFRDHSSWLAKVYVKGASAYESNDEAKHRIVAINKRIYEIHKNNDTDSDFARLYWQTRSWSYDYFSDFYKNLDVMPFDRYIGESETFEPGLALVRNNIGTIFEESDGAVILSKERSGFHTRVFITSEGLPTYEAKDLGVIQLEAQAFNYDSRIIMTGNDQKEYMKVVFAAMKLINPELGNKQVSLTHGTVKFGDGQKMSSRLGNVTRAVDVLSVALDEVQGETELLRQQIALGAVKYTFLKSGIGDDIAFDIDTAVSLEGNSGPYLQYALVRARNILRKIDTVPDLDMIEDLDEQERRLASWLSRYPETLLSCANNKSLHYLCSYLYELSQVFNQFYENSRVIEHERSVLRSVLVSRYVETLSDGLSCLGIPQPEQM